MREVEMEEVRVRVAMVLQELLHQRVETAVEQEVDHGGLIHYLLCSAVSDWRHEWELHQGEVVEGRGPCVHSRRPRWPCSAQDTS